MRPEPLDKKLYEKVKEDVKKRVKKFPSAYASGQIVQEYKRRGGKYSGKKPDGKTGISRWYKEQWVDVCKLPKIVPCGRKNLSLNDWKKDYPYCRPLKKVTSKTPKTVNELSKSELKRRCKQKKKNPMKRVTQKKKIK
jgi:hypothetical protein